MWIDRRDFTIHCWYITEKVEWLSEMNVTLHFILPVWKQSREKKNNKVLDWKLKGLDLKAFTGLRLLHISTHSLQKYEDFLAYCI